MFYCDGGCGYTSEKAGRCTGCDFGVFVPCEEESMMEKYPNRVRVQYVTTLGQLSDEGLRRGFWGYDFRQPMEALAKGFKSNSDRYSELWAVYEDSYAEGMRLRASVERETLDRVNPKDSARGKVGDF